MSEADPFPRERFAATLRHTPAYARLAWHLAREPLLSRMRKAAVVAAAGYLASPVDLVPGVIPVLGQLDDLAFAIAAIKLALAGLTPEKRHAHLLAVGLDDADLSEDLRTIGATTAWTLRAGGRTSARALNAGGRIAVRGGRLLGGLSLRAGGAAARLGVTTASKVATTATAAAGSASSAGGSGVRAIRSMRPGRPSWPRREPWPVLPVPVADDEPEEQT